MKLDKDFSQPCGHHFFIDMNFKKSVSSKKHQLNSAEKMIIDSVNENLREKGFDSKLSGKKRARHWIGLDLVDQALIS